MRLFRDSTLGTRSTTKMWGRYAIRTIRAAERGVSPHIVCLASRGPRRARVPAPRDKPRSERILYLRR